MGKLIMLQTSKPKPKAKHKTVRSADTIKYFTEKQIKLLRRTLRDADTLARQKKQISGVRDWALIDTLTSTGIRAAEAANLRCGDLKCGYGESAIYIRNGKGSKSRTVQIPDSLRAHLKSFLAWKKERGESTGEDDHLFIGQRGPWCAWTVSSRVKKYLRKIGLYNSGRAAHSLRHSYATELYRQQRDLRCVQKQLGHASVGTTQKYADVTNSDIQQQIKGLWGTV